MRRRGFTLIEVVISLFILTIIFSVGVSLSKFSSNLSIDVNKTGYLYEIQNLLSYSKAVCREKNKYGKITIRSSENKVGFVGDDGRIEKSVILPREIKIINEDINVFVTPHGKISKGSTIKMISQNGERQEISIGVGVDLIDIKNEVLE